MSRSSVSGVLVAVGLLMASCDPTGFWGDPPDPRPAPVPAAAPVPAVTPSEARAVRDAEASGLGFRPSGDGYRYVDDERKFKADIAADGTIVFEDLPRNDRVGEEGIKFGGRADRGEHGRGAQPEGAKLDVIERSSQLRAQMALTWYESQAKVRLQALERELVEIWGSTTATEQQRRRTIFLRWDEFEQQASDDTAGGPDDAAGAVDDVRRRVGADARRAIEAFIRRTLPAGGANAYPEAELAELNAERSSAEAFDPYAVN